MAKITFGAPIIRAAIASLQADFAAHVAAFNAEVANEVDLETPAAYVFGATDVMDAYPTVEVAILDGTLGPFALGEAGVGDSDHTPWLQVLVWIQGSDGEAPHVYESLLGYARVAIEILCETGKLGVEAEVSGGAESIRYSILDAVVDAPASPEREVRKWKVGVAVAFRVEAVERWQ